MKLADLKPDTRNANKGTDRGRKLIQKSLKSYGAGRSILIDKNGHIIAGNKTAEGAKAAGLEDVQVIKTDGSKLVAVQRTDLDINDKAARELAIADNRASEVSLDWDPNVLADFEKELSLETFWSPGDDPYLQAGKGSRPDALVLAADREGVEGHPTPKPMWAKGFCPVKRVISRLSKCRGKRGKGFSPFYKVWAWLLERGSPEVGQKVFDPFLGSGTTMVAAEQLGLGRICCGLEIEPKYVAVSLQRMADMGLKPKLANG